MESIIKKDSIVQEVIEQFQSRSDVGIKKYGTTLDRKDLSTDDWLEHLRQELMDAILYLTRLQKEIKKLERGTKVVYTLSQPKPKE